MGMVNGQTQRRTADGHEDTFNRDPDFCFVTLTLILIVTTALGLCCLSYENALQLAAILSDHTTVKNLAMTSSVLASEEAV